MDREAVQVTLLQAARVIARGGDLDSKLDTLAGHIQSAAGASAALIYLLNPVENLLTPAAQAGLDTAFIEKDEAIDVDDPDELVARVVRERRPATSSDRGAGARALRKRGHPATGVSCFPLVAADETGAEEAEGALLAAFNGPPPDPLAPEDPLSALADLCAVAIRSARLEHAMHERAEWMDRLATTDSLTGLANRATLLRMLELEIARATRQKTKLSLVVINVDGLAKINERAGAGVGDDVLRMVAGALADHVRLVDTIGRLGADEFGVIAPGAGGSVVGRRVQEAAARIEAAGEPVSLSVGSSVMPDGGATTDEFLAASRAALAEAKRRGRGQLVASGET
ncbi:MAG: sensor domain-containing diguanylate cyclase [Chloroflexota bacterium]|nr:sensor domain-containing diguanylate cyclase [Chloroflexota bacterium]